ncbi:fimbrial biogenesis outer membrane usher protein [Pantoea sp. LS15]|uniref:fimbria/pilus outer membrane usher protein n=1 Tax=Enterobacterales TaxID=91347 RepID=UPI000E0EF2D6|nr:MULTISPECIES: fimbria/pilus outer membrane usher protein [Enterobacterales]NJQ21999.1 fimbrial biogenesis outer membrane usher protein [Pantoea sp. LS15]NKF48595.1 fimbrial biogenesis outer membrane usher protein [Pantoea sp. LS15]RDK12734.1 fimbrial biogenesis outer membrane usher protein [Enterobacter sp. 9-2]
MTYKLQWIIIITSLLMTKITSATEFNINAIDKEQRGSVDLSLFKDQIAVIPGNYFVTISINNIPQANGWQLRWREINNQVQVCIPSELADTFALQDNIRNALPEKEGCIDFSSRPDIKFTFDQASQTLNVTIPQAWLQYRAADWMPPSTWDNGVPGVLLDYNLFASHYQPDNGSDTDNANTYGTAGANMGAWRLRSDYQYTQTHTDAGSEHNGRFSRVYMFRPLPSLGAKLTLGETDFQSAIFDAFTYTGASLISDERMLPWSLRGYAPQISGIAQTNATVTVSLADRVIYQSKVPPGPFVIQDLNQSVQGTLDVKVTEEDGRVSTFQVSAESVPFLTRKGQVRYKLAAGRARKDTSHDVEDNAFMSGEYSWGVLSQTSLYGGTLADGDHYRSLAAGIGQNMEYFGALSFDITQATSQLPNLNKQTGYSYRLNYSKRFDTTGSQLTLASYRYSDPQFLSYARFLDYDNNNRQSEKQTLSLTASQYISALSLNLYVNMLRQTWWNNSPSTTGSVTAGYNFDLGRWKNLGVTLSWSKTHYEDEDDDTQFYLSLSVPLDPDHRLNYDLHNSDSLSQNVSWYDTSDRNNTWGVSVGTESEKSDAGAQVSGNYQHYSPFGDLNLSGSYKANEYNSLSASWNGSFTSTAKGAALHRRSYGNEPRVMVSTDGVGNIPLNMSRDETNRFGIGVLPSISSYSPASVQVNMNNLPDGVDVDTRVVTSTWTEGAIGYRQIATRSGNDIAGILRTTSGTPPLGAVVRLLENDRQIAMVADDGHVWLGAVEPQQEFRVTWGDNQQCRFTLPSHLENSMQLILPCQ